MWWTDVMVFLAGLVFFLLGTIAVVWWLVGAVVALIQRRPDRPARVLRKLARVCAASAVVCYAFGIFAVGIAQGESSHGAESSPSPACRQSAPTPDAASHLVSYEAHYLPLSFECKLDDGTTYAADVVSPWRTPLTLALGAAAIALILIAGSRPIRRASEAAPVTA